MLGFTEELPVDWQPYKDAGRVTAGDRDREVRDRNQRNLVRWRWQWRYLRLGIAPRKAA